MDPLPLGEEKPLELRNANARFALARLRDPGAISNHRSPRAAKPYSKKFNHGSHGFHGSNLLLIRVIRVIRG